jgi:hypothetical protein
MGLEGIVSKRLASPSASTGRPEHAYHMDYGADAARFEAGRML